MDTFLELKNITKIYPGVRALDDVSLGFRKGEVHALLGENGAGKSTLIKILTGAIQPTKGTIILNGKEFSSFNPQMAIRLGISAIYQELNLIPSLSVAENIFYSREIMNGIFINKKAMNSQTVKLCNDIGIKIDPKALIKDLGIAYQQIVEIVKSFSIDVHTLIMDEPTAPLTKREIELLFRIVKQLKDKGVTIIYISHHLEEIFEICDRVTLLRDGKFIATKNVHEVNKKELISLMVGRELGENYPVKKYQSNEKVLEVKGFKNAKLKNISFDLKKGEILGFGGLIGAGRTEIARAIFGADKINEGEIFLKGEKVKINSPYDAINMKIGLIPEDRKHDGLILGLSVKENITYGSLDEICTMGFIGKIKEENLCSDLVADLRIKTASFHQKARNLSGGNQQKIVLAKWMATRCDILIFDEPTRGIDVGAKQEIYQLLIELAESGKGIIMISSEMPELIGLSDRIIVMHEGVITGELEKKDFLQERILELAAGS